MTKEELNQRIMGEMTPTEIALINFNIYLNPNHIEYYENFKMGKYEWCYNYLMKNRHLLDIKHTPTKQKTLAERMIGSAIALYR